ncbi:acyltransferase [Endozoicomonas sp. 8E]|uniref:acyltransferase n=1 Tax=Endozoicomonas sp. 8E TaxID=3035692 RepID=UPI0029394835|nr:DapH/DapD/GlmU-related protein [Endozoicomonas sp. 8E]WOG27279.1 DapH/DapD/GlmU-related protein [Endozoicomonas sp. 8E]
MRKNHKPFWIKMLSDRWQRFYIQHFFSKHFEHLGEHPMVVHPSTVNVHGAGISIGRFVHLISIRHNPVSLSTWSGRGIQGNIKIGDHCLISPGTTLSSAASISIGDNCMLAADCYISDSDWHGLYNRLRPFRCSKPIVLEDNVWVGHGAKVGKGITIGENSVVAAGAVVVKDVPPNTVVGGNPAKVIKKLNPQRRMLKREFMFRDSDRFLRMQEELDRYVLGGNSLRGWVRHKLFPRKGD